VADPGFWQGEAVSQSIDGVGSRRIMYFASKLCIPVNFHGALLVSSSGMGEASVLRLRDNLMSSSRAEKFLHVTEATEQQSSPCKLQK